MYLLGMDLRTYIQGFPRGERALEIARIATALGVSAPAVRHWISGIRPMSESVARDIELSTQGRVRCEALLPEVDWQRDEQGLVVGYRVCLDREVA